MRKPRGAAFKGSYRFKRTMRHYGKRKVTTQVEVPQTGEITHINEPPYITSATAFEDGNYVYTYVSS